MKKNRARKCVLDSHVLQRCLALCGNDDQLSFSARLTYPDIEECNTIISSILGVEVFHAYFVHPNVVGLAKLLLKLSLRLLSKYFFNTDVIYFSKTCFVNPYVNWSLTRWALANTKNPKTKSNIQKSKYKIHNHKNNIQKLLYWSRHQKPELRCELEYEKGSVALTSR